MNTVTLLVGIVVGVAMLLPMAVGMLIAWKALLDWVTKS